MNSISGSSTFSVGAHTNKGMSGMISGLDTDGLVKQMLSGTQAKIDKVTGQKQQLSWKQEIYRDLIKDINGFYDKFFGVESGTNLKSTNFFDAMIATTSSPAFRVSGTPSAATGITSVIVKQLAAGAKAESANPVSSQKLAGSFDKGSLDRTVVLEVGNDQTPISVDLAGATSVDDAGDAASIISKLNNALAGTGVEAKLNAKTKRLELTGKSVWVSGRSSGVGLQMLGLGANSGSIKDSDGNNILTGKAPSLNPELSITVALNGKQTNVKINLELAKEAAAEIGTLSRTNMELFQKDINDQLLHAFGTANTGEQLAALTLESNNENTGVTVTLTSPNGGGHQLSVAGDSTALTLFGLKSGQSDRISTSVALKDLSFAGGALSGERFSFTINEKEFSFDKNATLYEVMRKVNDSGAGVRMVYSPLDDKFSIESTRTGAGQNIRIEQTEGNLLTRLFGVDAGGKAVGNVLTTDAPIVGDSPAELKGGVFSLTVNGRNYSFSLPMKQNGVYDSEEALAQLNRALERQFGFESRAPGAQANLRIEKDGANYKLQVKNGMTVSFGEGSGDADLAAQLGFAKKTNVLTDQAAIVGKLAGLLAPLGVTTEAGLNGLGIRLETGGNPPGAYTGRFWYENTGSGLTKDQLANIGLAGAVVGTGSDAQLNVVRQGQNALLEINGNAVERSSNNFTTNGLTFELLAESKHNGTAEQAWTSGITDFKSLEIDSELKDLSGSTIGFLAPGLHRDPLTGDVVTRDVADKAGKLIGYLDAHGGFWEKPLPPGGQPPTSGVVAQQVGKYSVRTDFEVGTVTAERDSDKIFEGIKSFVDEYNKLIKTLGDYIDKEPTYKKYPPLTADQKKEMSNREIEQWEDKAKEGLLHNDPDISLLLDGMRMNLYQKPEEARYALYDIGIETGSYAKKGQLVMNETKLKAMLKSDPEAIRQLFTDPAHGLAPLMSKTIASAANLSYGSMGSLVRLAGMEGYASDKNNTIYWQMRDFDDQLRSLNSKYEKERQRYWNQFNQMENALAQMQNQSGWISQQFAMNG